MKEYKINGKIIRFRPHEFEGSKSIEYYENQIYTALSKIGVTKEYVEIDLSKENEKTQSYAQAKWIINQKEFVFRCESQKTTTKNLGAIAQAIQEDIRQITRGIKDLFTIMNQYEAKTAKPKRNSLLDYSKETSTTDKMFSINDIKIDSKTDSKLDPKYKYLEKYDSQKLEVFYLKFKEECIRSNTPNHPMLQALKIIRQKRGLKL